jgi:hypothetical protein
MAEAQTFFAWWMVAGRTGANSVTELRQVGGSKTRRPWRPQARTVDRIMCSRRNQTAANCIDAVD